MFSAGMKMHLKELEDIAKYFDSIGEPDNGKFMRSIARNEAVMIEALEIYANPFDRGFNVPDFYSEMDFSRFAEDAIKACKQ